MDDWSFRFSVPRRPEGTPLTAEEAERLLLARLDDGADPQDALWQLARFYALTGRQDLALAHVERLARLSNNPEDQAACTLAMGQLMEQQGRFDEALRFYRAALRLEPVDNGVWYLINNNLGYCLNWLGRPVEAEPHCRAAVRINPGRPNAFKNLGVSLAAQDRYAEAARAFVRAIRANASDGRALDHLTALLADHRDEVVKDVPEIDDLLARCQQAVTSARDAYRRALDPSDGG